MFLATLSSTLEAASFIATPTVWDVMRKQFQLNHEVSRTEVQAELKWLINHPDYIKRFANAEPYMYHILTEVKKRNLPGELALVPIIESAFDPFAYSGVGAAGLWQIMPGTATELGLKRDWWMDPRRSVGPSTDAALKYYAYLNKYFHGNWLLAIAAYDSGEGSVGRAIRRAGATKDNASFWQLNLPRETRIYVPRLLALAELIQHPQRYGVSLPPIMHEPYFEEVEIGQQIDLSKAAKLAGMPYQELIKLNPGYNRWATAPYAPYRLLLPKEKTKAFAYNLALLPKNEWLAWSRHYVKPGESIGLIAQKYRTKISLIQSFNHLKSDMLHAGQYILVPHPQNADSLPKTQAASNANVQPQPKSYKVIHITQRRDTFLSLYQKYGASEDQIRAWNHLGKDHPLHAGQELLIWKQAGPRKYTIQYGDSLSQIAYKQQTSVERLIAVNPGLNKDKIRQGQTIYIS